MVDIINITTIPIIEVATRLGIDVNKNKALCFMHDDRHPSLSFQPSKNRWKCFVCDVGGGVIDLVAKSMKLDRRGAIHWLASEFGFNSYLNTIRTIKYKAKQEASENIESEFKPDSAIYKDFVDKCSLSIKGASYIKSRGFSDGTIEHFNIKDVDTDLSGIEEYLQKRHKKERLISSGIMKMRNGKLRLIWWDHTVLFPFYNANNEIIYIQGRRVNPGKLPKYLNLCGVVKPLYNVNILNGLNDDNIVCICEGIPDTIMATQIGYYAVGVLGASSFMKEWVNILKRFRIIIVPDGDKAGSIFSSKIKGMFSEKGINVEEVSMPDGFDLSSYVSRKK